MVSDGRMPDNSVAYLEGLNPRTDIRHERRALTDADVKSLLRATSEAPRRGKMTGDERVMLYSMALTTGLRARELSSLTWNSLNLDGSSPTVKVLAAYSKHRRDDVLPLRHDIANRLSFWRKKKGGKNSDSIFPSFNPDNGARILKKDLVDADIPYRDKAGRVADFHSLRHTFISNLTRRGAPPKVAQSLARHSTISLTMDTYTHLTLFDERAAIDNMPTLPTPHDEGEENSSADTKTGTDDLSLNAGEIAYKPAYKKLTKKPYFGGHSSSSHDNGGGEESEESGQKSDIDKSLSEGGLGKGNHGLTAEDKWRRREDSNPRCLSAQRFSRPPTGNRNQHNNNELRDDENTAYKPAYKQKPKTGIIPSEKLPPDLAAVVEAWPRLPEHIKQSIKALVLAATTLKEDK